MSVRGLLILSLLPIVFEDAGALQNVRLEILPPEVKRGDNATLLCLYDLQGAPLYSVKWYRGNHEFYRFSPQENPKTKIFPFDGVTVDLKNSNSSRLTLLSVGFKLSGNLSCEVTTDAPLFSSNLVSRHMTVIELPERGPTVLTEKSTYEIGEKLRANCSSPPSRPPATLSFLLNNIPVGKPDTRFTYVNDTLVSSFLSLDVILEPYFFSNRGILELKCTALITTIYRNTTQVRLKSSIAEPVPERVTLSSPAFRTIHSTAVFVPIILISSILR